MTLALQKSLCSNKALFGELVLYDKPKYITLAHPDTTSTVLGQGTLDIIINNKHRIQIFVYYTKNSDLLMLAVDHLSYNQCKIIGKDGIIQVKFPTFHFNVRAIDNFECFVTPGKTLANQPYGNQLKRLD